MHRQGSRCIEFKFCLFNKVKVIQILVNCLRCITNTRVWWRILHSTRDSLRSSLVLCNILHHVRVLVIHLSQFTSISILLTHHQLHMMSVLSCAIRKRAKYHLRIYLSIPPHLWSPWHNGLKMEKYCNLGKMSTFASKAKLNI